MIICCEDCTDFVLLTYIEDRQRCRFALYVASIFVVLRGCRRRRWHRPPCRRRRRPPRRRRRRRHRRTNPNRFRCRCHRRRCIGLPSPVGLSRYVRFVCLSFALRRRFNGRRSTVVPRSCLRICCSRSFHAFFRCCRFRQSGATSDQVLRRCYGSNRRLCVFFRNPQPRESGVIRGECPGVCRGGCLHVAACRSGRWTLWLRRCRQRRGGRCCDRSSDGHWIRNKKAVIEEQFSRTPHHTCHTQTHTIGVLRMVGGQGTGDRGQGAGEGAVTPGRRTKMYQCVYKYIM